MHVGLDLIIQYYSDPRPDRRAELEYCVRRNLANRHVDSVHNLGAHDTPLPDDIRGHSKFTTVGIDHRMTFRDAFDHANRHLVGRMVGICNLDIFLDDDSDWHSAERLVRSSSLVLCQSRTEFSPVGGMHLDPTFARLAFANAQDAWFFVAPLQLPAIDFELGTLGCDNALAERIKRAGAIPVNMASRYRILHYDVCRGKQGGNTNEMHRCEAASRGTTYSQYPEQDGCYLTPDIDMIPSIDDLLRTLAVDEIRRYQIISDIVSERIQIRNT